MRFNMDAQSFLNAKAKQNKPEVEAQDKGFANFPAQGTDAAGFLTDAQLDAVAGGFNPQGNLPDVPKSDESR